MRAEGGRNLRWWQFLLLVLVYAAIIQIGGRVIGADVDADEGQHEVGFLVEQVAPARPDRGGEEERGGHDPHPALGP